jgi:hypothetical protein
MGFAWPQRDVQEIRQAGRGRSLRGGLNPTSFQGYHSAFILTMEPSDEQIQY